MRKNFLIIPFCLLIACQHSEPNNIVIKTDSVYFSFFLSDSQEYRLTIDTVTDGFAKQVRRIYTCKSDTGLQLICIYDVEKLVDPSVARGPLRPVFENEIQNLRAMPLGINVRGNMSTSGKDSIGILHYEIPSYHYINDEQFAILNNYLVRTILADKSYSKADSSRYNTIRKQLFNSIVYK